MKRTLLFALLVCSCDRREKEQPVVTPVATEKAPPPPKFEPAPTVVVPTLVPPPKDECAEMAGDYSKAMREHNYTCVRAILVPKLEAKTITANEARYLVASCNAIGDKECERLARPFTK